MGYVNYNIDENYIEVCKGDTRQKVICETSKKNPDISAIYYNNECIGVGIKHFLTESEIEGIKGELIFKKILDESELPYLYVGQNSYGIERSSMIVDKQKSKRPDYLVSFKSIGNILFDVKCRRKLKLLNEDTHCFSMYLSEIEALKKMGQSMSLPIWLAFIDKIELDSKIDIDVYIVSIDSLIDYAEKMKLNEEILNNDSLVAIRIPNELLIKVNTDKQISLDIPKISLETIKKYSNFPFLCPLPPSPSHTTTPLKNSCCNSLEFGARFSRDRNTSINFSSIPR
jgi:hypothetical protein